jgi:hypothetical protein
MPRHVASIKCGSCKGRHTTVAAVQLCFREMYEAKALTAREEHDAEVEAMASAEPAAWAPHFHPGEFDECRVNHDVDKVTAFEARAFHLRGYDRARPW